MRGGVLRRLVTLAFVGGALPALLPAAPAQAAVDHRFVLPIGAPFEDVDGAADAGALTLIPRNVGNGDLQLSRTITIDESDVGGAIGAGNEFGATVAQGDVDGDGDTDLVIGAPGANGDRGRVYVVKLTPANALDFAHATLVRPGFGGIAGASEVGDRFGAALTIGGSLGGQHWLAVGAPGEDIGTVRDAGAVSIVPNGTSGAGDQLIWQGEGAPGVAERGDRFGTALARWYHTTNYGLAVGVPGEDTGDKVDAGEVDLLFASAPNGLPGSGPSRAVLEGRGTGPGVVEAGDRFGSGIVEIFSTGGVGQLAIAAPYEDVGTRVDAGAVSIYNGETDSIGLQYNQNTPGVPDAAESNDHFGASIGYSQLALVIGVPGEDLGGVSNAGAVHSLHAEGGNPFSGPGSALFSQATTGVPGATSAGDAFGTTVVMSNMAVSVGIPGEGRTAARSGGVTVFFMDSGSGRFVANTSVFIDQDTAGIPGAAEPNDRFGRGGATSISP